MGDWMVPVVQDQVVLSQSRPPSWYVKPFSSSVRSICSLGHGRAYMQAIQVSPSVLLDVSCHVACGIHHVCT
jgi:hypothetical protein